MTKYANELLRINKIGVECMTNFEVVKNFENGYRGKSLNMFTDGYKLYSYTTCVAQHTDKGIVKNSTKYSRTTSKQLTHLNYDLITVDNNIPIDTLDLLGYATTTK